MMLYDIIGMVCGKRLDEPLILHCIAEQSIDQTYSLEDDLQDLIDDNA